MSASEHSNREVIAFQMKRQRCHLKRESTDSTDSTRTAVRLSRGLQSAVCGEPSLPILLRTFRKTRTDFCLQNIICSPPKVRSSSVIVARFRFVRSVRTLRGGSSVPSAGGRIVRGRPSVGPRSVCCPTLWCSRLSLVLRRVLPHY